MNKKEQILQMYFEEHKIQDMIAKSVGVSQSYISQVIKSVFSIKKEVVLI